MPAHPITDWSQVDWHRPNRQIMEELDCSTWTVIDNRKKHAPETVGKYRARYLFTDESKSRQLQQISKNGKKNQPKATAAASLSPKSGKFETNQFAKKWELIAPDGQHFMIVNLHHFVREHADLFSLSDVQWSKNGKYCKAIGGLMQAPKTKKGEWKGWAVRKIQQNT